MFCGTAELTAIIVKLLLKQESSRHKCVRKILSSNIYRLKAFRQEAKMKS